MSKIPYASQAYKNLYNKYNLKHKYHDLLPILNSPTPDSGLPTPMQSIQAPPRPEPEEPYQPIAPSLSEYVSQFSMPFPQLKFVTVLSEDEPGFATVIPLDLQASVRSLCAQSFLIPSYKAWFGNPWQTKLNQANKLVQDYLSSHQLNAEWLYSYHQSLQNHASSCTSHANYATNQSLEIHSRISQILQQLASFQQIPSYILPKTNPRTFRVDDVLQFLQQLGVFIRALPLICSSRKQAPQVLAAILGEDYAKWQQLAME